MIFHYGTNLCLHPPIFSSSPLNEILNEWELHISVSEVSAQSATYNWHACFRQVAKFLPQFILNFMHM